MSGVLDSHVHVWDPRRFDYPWLDGFEELDRAFLPEQVDRANSETRAMMFVQADCRPEQALAEAAWVASADWPELVGIVAGADLRSAELAGELDRLGQLERVCGVRHLLQAEPTERFGELRAGLAELAQRDWSFDACVRHEQLPALLELVGELPGLRVVIDHFGKPPVDAGLGSAPGRAWLEAMRALAGRPNTWVKLSGLAAEASDSAAFDAHADGFIAATLEAFGPERAMFGSDWPVSARLGGGVGSAAWLERVRRIVGADPAARAAVEFDSAAACYRTEPR